MFSKKKMNEFTGGSSDKTALIREKIQRADAVVIGDFPQQRDLLTAGSVLKSTLLILERNTVFPICIPEAFTITIHWKNTGLTGAGIFM